MLVLVAMPMRLLGAARRGIEAPRIAHRRSSLERREGVIAGL